MTDTVEATKPNMQPISALAPEETERLGTEIVAALKTVFDPEIPADIYELGLIYRVDIKDDRAVSVEMTLTTPNCPAAGELPTMVENPGASVGGVCPGQLTAALGAAGARAQILPGPMTWKCGRK